MQPPADDCPSPIAASCWARLVGYLIMRSLLKQLGGEPDYAAEAVRKICRRRPDDGSRHQAGDTTSLMYSLKTMQDSLRKIVAEIQNIVEAANRAISAPRWRWTARRATPRLCPNLLNQLSDTVDGAFKDTIRVAQALAQGDLSQKITKEYSGAYSTRSK